MPDILMPLSRTLLFKVAITKTTPLAHVSSPPAVVTSSTLARVLWGHQKKRCLPYSPNISEEENHPYFQFLTPSFCLQLFLPWGQNSNTSISGLGHSPAQQVDSSIPHNLNLEHGQAEGWKEKSNCRAVPCVCLSVVHLGKRVDDTGATEQDSWHHSWWISRARKFLEHHLLQLESQLEEEGREELVEGRKRQR